MDKIMRYILLFLLSFSAWANTAYYPAAGVNCGGPSNVARTSVAALSNGLTLFTATGDVQVQSLIAEDYTANTSVSTLQWSVTANSVTTTISGASASLATSVIGTAVIIQPGALSNAPIVTTASGSGALPWGTIRVTGGSTIKAVIGGTTPTNGTWATYISYIPLECGASIIPAF